jgi:hypothetical protein
MNRPSLRTALAGLAIVTLVAAGCGDDDDDTTADSADEPTAQNEPEASADEGAYCEASLAVETAPAPEIDFATATEEEIAAGFQAWAKETMGPLVENVMAVVPADIADDGEVLQSAFDQTAAGDPTAFDVPDVVAAAQRVHRYDLDTCGWDSLEVAATDYSFAQIPGELPEGVVSFEFVNAGAEVHELLVVRKNDGTTESAEELLAMEEDEAFTKVTMLGEPAFAPPGDGDFKVVDLEPGEYIVLCAIPTGMTSDDGPPPEGPPHFTHGMFAEFTVG